MGLDLTTPEAQANAYFWLVVLLAHAALGVALTGIVAAVIDRIGREWIDHAGGLALAIVTVGYAGLWEGAVQRFGAGLGDAAVDTVAVLCGGAVGLWAWRRNGLGVAAGILALSAVAVAGVRKRR